MIYPVLATDGAIYTVWGVSLAIGVIVLVVVAVLLTLIVRTARQIDSGVSQIWNVGQRIANNTVHIPLLNATNRLLIGILVRASGIDQAASQIEQHADNCPGCPQCVLGSGGRSSR